MASNSLEKGATQQSIKAYMNIQHTRRITPTGMLPENGVTAGAGNCYMYDGSITYGTTGKTGYYKVVFDLPPDFVDGTDIILRVWWRAAAASEVVEYSNILYLGADGANYVAKDTEAATWTAPAVAWSLNRETLTFDGTDLIKNNLAVFLLSMEDDNNTAVSMIESVSLDIQVNGRD